MNIKVKSTLQTLGLISIPIIISGILILGVHMLGPLAIALFVVSFVFGTIFWIIYDYRLYELRRKESFKRSDGKDD